MLTYQLDEKTMSVNVRDEVRTKLAMADRIPEQDQPSISRQRRSEDSVMTGVGGARMCHPAPPDMKKSRVSYMARKHMLSDEECGSYVNRKDATVFPSKTRSPAPPPLAQHFRVTGCCSCLNRMGVFGLPSLIHLTSPNCRRSRQGPAGR